MFLLDLSFENLDLSIEIKTMVLRLDEEAEGLFTAPRVLEMPFYGLALPLDINKAF